MRPQETQLGLVRDLLGVCPYSWNPRTAALDWDNRLREMWGLPAGAAIDEETFKAGVHSDDWPRVEAAVAQSVDPDGDGAYALEYRVIGIGDGVERWVQTYGRAIFRNRTPIDIVGVVIDITERKRSETRLRESEQLFRMFAENTNDVLWIGNADREAFDYLSPAYERVWGAKVGSFEPTFRHWVDSLHPDDRSQAAAGLARVYEGEARTLNYRIIRSDGGIRRIRDAAFPIFDRQGKVGHVGGIAQDVTRASPAQVYIVGAGNSPPLRLMSAMRGAGYRVTYFASARGFLEVAAVLQPGCALLDAGSATDELAIVRELEALGSGIRSIVVGRDAEGIAPAVEAMKSGASDYLGPNCQDEAVLAAVASAMTKMRDADSRDHAAENAAVRVANVSTREREVLEGLLCGGSNKTIARELGISPRTVELHRAHLMERTGSHSLGELLQIALTAGLKPGKGLHAH